MARFFRHMISENVQVFWAALQRGEFITDAAEAVGTYRKQGARWVIANGGLRPRRGRHLQARYLCFAERERPSGTQRFCGRSNGFDWHFAVSGGISHWSALFWYNQIILFLL